MAIFDCVDFSRVERVERVERGSDVVRRPSLASVCLKLFAAAALAFAGLSAKAADSLTMADFNHSIKLQVNGYTGTETLVNFPVLVRVSETRIPGFHFADMSAKNVNGKAMGYDLAFFAEDGTRLELEKDTWDIDKTVGTTGEMLVWVKLPRMKQGTKFYMCYNVADGVYVTSDKPWGDYVGVWHLNETGKNPTIADSTDNGLDGKALANNGEAVSEGKIGGARRIAKDSGHAHGIVIDATNGVPQKAVADSLGTDFHASFWMMSKAGTSYDSALKWGNILGRRKGDKGYSWGFGFGGDNEAGTTVDYMRVHSDNTQGSYAPTSHAIGSVLKLDGLWNKVDLVWKYATNGNVPVVNVYTNGVLDEVMTKQGKPVRLEDANIGIGCSTQDNPDGTNNKGRRFNGSMDEVRLRPGIVSDDWVKADFDTVNNVNFVTIAPPDVLEIEWAENSERIGVTNVAMNAFVVGGTVVGFGSNTMACVIQGKFWKDGESEPSEWTVLKDNLNLFDGFEVSIPCDDGASYSYKLRAVDDASGETEPVTGTFTTPTTLAVTWAERYTVGVTNVFEHVAVIGGTLDDLGSSTSATVQGKFWHGDTEPTEWTTVGAPLSQTGDFSVSISGLSVHTDYSFKLRVVGISGAVTEPVSGAFTTRNELTVVWSNASSENPGIARISYGYVIAGGAVSDLGDSTRCSIVYKLWVDGEQEPDAWMTLSENLGEHDTCSESITVLDGRTYCYKFKAVGDVGEETAEVSGTFTSMSAVSSETQYYDDGTNAYWVVKEFERYLPFTVTGYTGTETLTNFPVLVDVRKNDANGFNYDDFYHTGGRDIAFVDERGHVIPHEIDTWNPNGMTLIWVRLPEMNNGTKFTMCYRSPLVNPPADPGNVFEKYVGVWHMNEKGDGIVDVVDSTVNRLDGETHANSLAYSSGRIGYARRVAQQAGTSSTYGHILVRDKNDILRTGVGNVFTYSCWSKLADNAPGWAYLVSRKSEDASNGWGVQYHDGNVSDKLRAYGGSTVKNEYVTFNVSGYSHKTWAYWTFVFSNQTFAAYLNGNKQSSVTLKHPVANDDTAELDGIVIGGQQIGTGALNGWVDECRYSKGMRSPDWIKAEYASTLQVDTPFVTKGTQVGRGVESLVPVVVWETGAGLPDTVIDVSYAYVQFAGTVTFCGSGADTCRIEYQMWADGEEIPEKDDWAVLLDNATAGTKFSIPVFGLKQDMPYNFRIRAVNEVGGEIRKTLERTGSFRTNGNVNESAAYGELFRINNRFVHLFRAGAHMFTTPDYVTNVEIIVVGGGGAGGYKIGGGGGGGGVFYSQSYGVTTNTTYFITVGRGGEAPTNTTTVSSVGNGEYSAVALFSDQEHPLIRVPGGGGGGSCSKTANIVSGADGASGGGAGGRGDASQTGASGGPATFEGGYGHAGGDGNHKQNNGSAGAYAAGGGGGGRREGLSASSDKYYGGGAGGSGVACAMLGEMLYFGAGGGGGYAYSGDANGFTKPGAGGSGVGGNAADVKNGTLATSGVANTGAGGGGGSMSGVNNNNDTTYWQGGNGGDGVVLIAYEVHGRDPVADDPRISMTRCAYNEDDIIADIDYRVYWAGIQNDVSDILIHYSTVSSNELNDTDSGVLLKVAESAVGVGSFVFTPPEVGYTYWVRLVARKHASSYSSSEEIASFTVPAVTLNGATWTESKTSPSEDFATVSYKLFDTNEVTHLYCYWSENESALEGDVPPSGDDVYLLDLGVNANTNLSGKTSFKLPAAEGLVRNRTYYIRLAAGDAQGIKHSLSEAIVALDTAEKPIALLSGATWSKDSNAATVNFSATVGKLDPTQTELVALYSRVQNDVKGKNPESKESVTVVSLGFCSDLALDDVSPSATFPLWSDVVTNYYVRLALSTNVVVNVGGVITTNRVIVSDSYSSATKEISVSHAVEANTLLYIVTANPKIACYGDAVQAIDYAGPEFAGLTEGWGFENRYELTGEMACEVTGASPSGNYPITQNTLQLENGGAEKQNTVDGVEYHYQYKLAFSGAIYTITNAVFATSIEDVVTNYTGVAYDTSRLVRTLTGVRNEQPVTYLYRVGGAGEWGAMPELVDEGNYNVQFKATAPNHDDVHGSFKVTIAPAPLEATISAAGWSYTGEARQPVVTTNVTGLIRGDLNPLTCEFRDAAGEWQAEVPSFTEPGEYKLYFRVSAPNHTTFTTNCTFTIEGWDYMVNMDGDSGFQTAISVSDPGWFLRATGLSGDSFSKKGDRYAKLDEICPNGLKLWQNYVIERDDLSKKLVAAIHQNCQRVANDCFELRFPNIDALHNTGLNVRFRVDRKLKGESEFTIGELTDKYEVNVSLEPQDPTGLYIFNMIFVPTNALYAGQQSVLTSVATVGVLRVSSALTNTVVAVPWRSMTIDSTNDVNIVVSDVVNPNGVSAGDMILSYNSGTGNFNGWMHDGYGEWDEVVTVTKKGLSVSSAEVARLPRGKAFWLLRSAPGPYIYLVGRYTGEDYLVELDDGTPAAPGHTLVANPTFNDVDLNSLVFVDKDGNVATPAVGDRIVTQNIAGLQTIYFRNAGNTQWGCKVLQRIGNRTKQVWSPGGTIPAGTGFWYMRTGDEALKIKFEAAR